MARLTRDQMIEAIRNIRIERAEMHIPELGGSVFVRGMSGKERDKFEESLRIKQGKRSGQSDLRTFRARHLSQILVDEHGARLFNDSDADIDLLGKLPSGVMDRIIQKCSELSGKGDEEVEVLGNGSAREGASDDSSSTSLES